MLLHLLILFISAVMLFWSANWLVHGIMRVARYLRWRGFVIAFFVMAIVSSFPNLFVGVMAALRGIPELSFGDVVGNSVVDLTLVAALAVFFGKELRADSKVIQTSSLYTIAIAVLPVLLIVDHQLSRGDGIVLLAVFFFYSIWLFSKRNEYSAVYEFSNGEAKSSTPFSRFQMFLQSLGAIGLGMGVLLLSAMGVVRAVEFFAAEFHLPITLIGILVIGLGSALPELYFTIASARKGKSKIILGDLMGAVIVMATLVLGTVALIHPISVTDFSPFAIARFFLLVSALFFFVFLRTGRKISYKEAFFLVFVYIAFIAGEMIVTISPI